MDAAVVFLMTLCFGLAVLVLISNENVASLKMAAVERGYALHCPIDGEWAWKGECDGGE